MVKEDIVGGLKNAIERGENLEQAKQTFINAGYSADEVEQAAASLGGIIASIATPQTQPTSQQIPPKQSKQLPAQAKKPEKKSRKSPIVFLIIILILLIGIVVASYIFKDQIISFISNLFS
jgi:cobalamin biosynthesis Mg chelatase CobN